MLHVRKEFIRLMDNAWNVQEFVASMLDCHGIPAWNAPLDITPDLKSRSKHSDQGDILIIYENQLLCVEVKHWPKRHFEGIKDLPRKWPGFAVSAVHAVDKPHAVPITFYVTVNADCTGYLRVDGVTRSAWFKHCYQTADRQNEEMYCCPKELVREFKFFHQGFEPPVPL